jgi:hypothetical protein
MAKRFTDTAKWDRQWFQDLAPAYKLFWMYLCDRCDHAGIWLKNMRMAEFMIGDEISEEKALALFGDRVKVISENRWFVARFISFQYGELNAGNRVHASVIKSMASLGLSEVHGSHLEGPSKPHRRGGQAHKDKEKDLDKAKGKDRVKDKDSVGARP